MAKCESCKLKSTGWCKGCEHFFPGVNQFDFYEEINEKDDEKNDENILPHEETTNAAMNAAIDE